MSLLVITNSVIIRVILALKNHGDKLCYTKSNM